MEHTSCREDRIQHALDRCLHGLRPATSAVHAGNAGLCMNHWSLEELVRRDPENSFFLLQQILRKAREVQDQSLYELVTPLALMFSSTLLLTPFLPPNCPLLMDACEVFSGFLSWPEPYSGVCRDLLTILCQELKAPGISYHRLVREEQGLSTAGHRGKIMTVLLLDPADVSPEFLSVSEQLSSVREPHQEIHITLIKHAFQAALGSTYPLPSLHYTLQSKSPEELEELCCTVTDILETSASMRGPEEARRHLLRGLEEVRENMGVPAADNGKSDGVLQTLSLPVPKCHMYHWDSDNFDVLDDILERECDLAPILTPPGDEEEEEVVVAEEEEEEEEEEEQEEGEENGDEMGEEEAATDGWAGHRASTLSTLSTASKDSMFSISSTASSCSTRSEASGADSDFFEEAEDSPPERVAVSQPRLHRRLSKLFKPWGSGSNSSPLSRVKSLGSPETQRYAAMRPARFMRLGRSNSQLLPGKPGGSPPPSSALPPPLERVRFRRSSVLGHDPRGGRGGNTLRVVVFGADRAAGKVARAYSHLRSRWNACPIALQLFFVPVTTGSGCTPAGGPSSPEKMPETPPRDAAGTDVTGPSLDSSTNDIAQLIGMLDPWYERNVLSILSLPVHFLCQKNIKLETDSHERHREHLPIFADLVLYYCRQATRPTLVQLYQAELTLAGGERRTEVFIHSLELGHVAGTRAVRATRAASKRFGIVGDREAVPLILEIFYNKVTVSGRNWWTKADKVCTSINLTKACRSPEELDSRTEWLQMAVTEVVKRQNSKSKIGYNQQLSTTEVKVDQVQVCSGSTFAVCLDQDKKKVFQSVTRCEVSVCFRPDSSSEWRLHTDPSDQSPFPHPTLCSLLCLPVATFSGARPWEVLTILIVRFLLLWCKASPAVLNMTSSII
ncbi:hypothetical protein AAFF_G00339190 [Aldrovandia affinis]|uniref:Phosphoinositide 3-kinase regulatory subunit 5 n=1 Tax=Aldrovandia affinis TaxID=143900 RepID=A0AAD7SK63_9TELE|nr:hypothetical protein AAFF_G00339190 [Aldrovandia affinis]